MGTVSTEMLCQEGVQVGALLKAVYWNSTCFTPELASAASTVKTGWLC